MSQLTELTLLILFVDEHQENLQDETLVLVSPAHLDHEQKDAEVMKAESML